MNDDALQALMDMGDRLTASMRENPDGTHTTDDEWAWLLTLSASTVHLIRNLRGARVDRDALAAKVADAWDEGFLTAHYMERGCGPFDDHPLPDHLVDQLRFWNPHHPEFDTDPFGEDAP